MAKLNGNQITLETFDIIQNVIRITDVPWSWISKQLFLFVQDDPAEITVVAEIRNSSGNNKLYDGGQGAIEFDVTVTRKIYSMQIYRASDKGGPQVAWMLQAKPSRSGKQQQEQNSPTLGTAF